MKELLTKKFWQDVKKTFEDARDGAAEEQPAPSGEQVAGPKPQILIEPVPSPADKLDKEAP